MRPLSIPFVCGLLLALPSAGQTPATGPEPAAPQTEEVFIERVEVNVVNVVVWVTDKKGRPIHGLTRDDFELYEDGRQVPISNFFEVETGRPVTPGTSLLDPADQQTGPLPYLPTPEDQRLSLIVYVDNFNIAPSNRNRVLRRLRRFLFESVGADDQVMVVSHDRSLHIRQPFTSDPDLALAALQEIEELSGNPPDRLKERLRVLQEIERQSNGLTALSEAHSRADYLVTETEFTLRRLREVVSALAGLQGRKALLYVSDGVPMTPAEDLFIAVEERFPKIGARGAAMSYDLGLEFRRLGNLANTSGVTFYTLDAGGAELHSSLSAEDPGTTQGGGRAMVDSVYIANLQEPLHFMADATGGLAITNTNAVETALDRVAGDFQNYYSLGFAAEHAASGRYYEFDVEVKRPGVRVRHRDGYRDHSPQALITDGSLAALYFGYEHNVIGARMVFDRASRKEDGTYLVSLSVEVPIEGLALVPRQQKHVGRFRFAFAVMDAGGNVSPVQQPEPMTLEIPADELDKARGGHFTYETQLLMKRGSSKVAVAIHDEVANQSSFVSDTVTLGSG